MPACARCSRRQCRIFLGQWLPDVFVPALFALLVAASIALTSLGQLVGLMGHRFGGWGWVCGFAALLVIIAAAVLGVVFAPRSVQLSLVLLFFEPARAAAAAGASALGALAVCGRRAGGKLAAFAAHLCEMRWLEC